MYAKIAIVVIYILLDLLYVSLSNNVYNGYVKTIEGGGKGMSPNLISVAFAYISIIVGWLVLVAPRIEQAKTVYTVILVAVAFGITIFGTFNFTLNIMFDKWDYKIMIRDTTWGITAATIVSLAYYTLLTQKLNK